MYLIEFHGTIFSQKMQQLFVSRSFKTDYRDASFRGNENTNCKARCQFVEHRYIPWRLDQVHTVYNQGTR